MENQEFKYNIIFDNIKEQLLIIINKKKTIKELIELYFETKKKSNLLNDNFEYIYFIYNGNYLRYKNNLQTVESFFGPIQTPKILVQRLEYYNELTDYEEEELIKDNVLTIVYKAKRKNDDYLNKYVAIKKIKKDALKEELKFKLNKIHICKEDFRRK